MRRNLFMPILLPLLAMSVSAAAQTSTHSHSLQFVLSMDNLVYMLVIAPVALAFLGLFLHTRARQQHKANKNNTGIGMFK